MKKIILFIFTLTLLISISYAQRLKYDDIFNLLLQKDYSRAYSLLFDYQQKDPEFPNTYFQLGNLSYQWAIESDPFKELDQTEYYIHNTKLFFGLAISKLNIQEKDAQRNSKLYQNINELSDIKKLNNSIVSDYINSKLDLINNFDSSIHNSVYLLNKTVSNYQKTVSIYTFIITNFPNISDLYLIQKDSILKSTNKLIFSYDSTIYYFNKYKKSLKENPILNYKQKIYPQTIKTYRLQGLTKTDFLNDSILIWDYKTWAKDLQKELNTNIQHFRETISKTNKALTDEENKIQNYKKFTNVFKQITLEQKVVFEIEKYDNNSLVTKLFEYKISKINLLILYKRIFNDTSNFLTLSQKREIELFNLIKQKNKTDSLLLVFENNISEKDYNKHIDFFNKNYNAYNGLISYPLKQTSSNDNILNNSINNALFFTLRDIFNIPLNQKILTYKNSKIYTYVSVTEAKFAKKGTYTTTAVTMNEKAEKFITGYYKTDSSSTPFVAKISNNNIAWLKLSSSGINTFEYGSYISSTYDGCFVIIHSINNSKHYNTIVKLNNNGQQEYSYKISNQSIPRYFKFDEINNKVLIAFQGQKLDYYNNKSDTLYLEELNMRKNAESEWKKTIILDGNLINIIKIDTNFHIFANYHLLSIDQKNIVNSNENIIHLKTDLKGNFIEANDIKSKFFIYGLYAYKLNSNTINIIGTDKQTNIFKSIDQQNIPQCYYIVIDKNNKIIYENQ